MTYPIQANIYLYPDNTLELYQWGSPRSKCQGGIYICNGYIWPSTTLNTQSELIVFHIVPGFRYYERMSVVGGSFSGLAAVGELKASRGLQMIGMWDSSC